eukprot:CAMPEP_0113483388 /NCGR_PEP_ID=MMETSP0014_2-20120614/23407_1 /TAXON_ID=2857 /ORGANISM="Nitzschia sp." /LENGTH=428 /DNA_ID=CAMNT_0000376931 /DNA_START=215 /DNA_END=1501 /DNA_ORIENTATION=+ /assembly_acc=CAM_ASM_000159
MATSSSSSSSSTTLINVVPDAEQKLVRVLASSSSSSSAAAFTSACESAISQGDAALLLKTIIDNDEAIKNALLVNLSESEAISAVSLLGALLNRVDNNNSSKQPTASALLESLSSSIVRNAAGSGSVGVNKTAITLVATLYNIRSFPTDKVKLLTKMVDAAASKVPEMLEPKTSKTSVVLSKFVVEPTYSKTMFDEWTNTAVVDVDVDVVRKFYRSASNAATVIKLPTVAQHFVLLEVQTYKAGDSSSTECIDAATKASTGAIRDPVSLFTIQRNMLTLPAIKALEGKSSSLFALLKVFQEGNLQDYNSYLKSNGGENTLTQWDLKPEDCTKNMRVLTLCSLASELEEIPYTTVAKELDVPPTDVEKWIITAVSSGLLSAKMDQMGQTVMVERCVVRRCDMEQWRALQSRLNVWKNNVGEVLKQAMKA